MFAALVHEAPDAVVVVDQTGKLVYVNNRACELFGYDPAELVGKPVEVLLPEDVRGPHVEMRKGYMAAPTRRPMGTGRNLRAKRGDGRTFPVDVSLSPLDTAEGRVVTAFVRDATAQRRRQYQAEAIAEIAAALLEGRPVVDVLTLTASHARTVTASDTAWVVTPVSADMLAVRAAAGVGAELLVGAEGPYATTLSGQAMRDGQPVLVESLSADGRGMDPVAMGKFGPAMYVPLATGDRRFGTLVTARLEGGPPFSADDVESARLFASSAAVTLAFGETRDELERQHVTAEQERIGRELLNRVIHEAFGVGLLLQSTVPLAGSEAGPRLDEAVSRLDDVIRTIRSVVFGSQSPLDTA
jgi:PAS domain S-box-containing protein